MPANSEVSVQELIDSLMDFNSTTLNNLMGLLEKLESDLMDQQSDSLQGELEEILRMILNGVVKTMEAILAMQQDLQTRVVESFFPAQD